MEITQLLERAAEGQQAAANQLLPIIYERLRVIARRQLSLRDQRMPFETKELVHEAYLALFGDADVSWRSRGHFFAYAAKAMRNILIDRARRHLSQKRGGGVELIDAADADDDLGVDSECLDLVALDQALTRIANDHPRLVRVIELRFFAGFSVQEVADVLEVTTRSVERDWQKARAIINLAMDASAKTKAL